MTETIEKSLKTVEERLEELRPAHEEFLSLNDFLDVVKGFSENKVVPKQSKPRRRRGKVTEQVRQIVQGNPEGITVQAIAAQYEGSPTYTYHVVRKLVETGEFRRNKGKVFLKATP